MMRRHVIIATVTMAALTKTQFLLADLQSRIMLFNELERWLEIDVDIVVVSVVGLFYVYPLACCIR